MPTRGDTGEPSGDPLPREAVASAIHCIEQDFRRLVETLGRTLDLVATRDEVLSLRLSAAKEAAERGLKLTQLLLELPQIKRD